MQVKNFLLFLYALPYISNYCEFDRAELTIGGGTIVGSGCMNVYLDNIAIDNFVTFQPCALAMFGACSVALWARAG
jgi:hypothetical protein